MRISKIEEILLTCTEPELNELAERMEKGIETEGSYSEEYQTPNYTLRFSDQTPLEPRRRSMIRVGREGDVITIYGDPKQFREIASEMKRRVDSVKLGESLKIVSFAGDDGETILTFVAEQK